MFRTTDAGVTWQPLFERGGSASIGALAVAPSDPRVLWVGTGQVHMRWDIVDGDGVYRSTDGGATWTHVGLEETRHIGNLHVDPRDADVAVVAALGHVFGPNPERGLFRTEDGGQTWTPRPGSGSRRGRRGHRRRPHPAGRALRLSLAGAPASVARLLPAHGG